MHEHDLHKHCCKHESLRYCEVCQVVYCTKCGKEWREYGYAYTYTYPTYPISTWTTTTGNTLTCDHSNT